LLGLDLAVLDLSWVRLHDEYRTEGFPPNANFETAIFRICP